MRYFLIGSAIVVVLLGVFAGFRFYRDFPKVGFEVSSLNPSYAPGEKISLNIKIKNESRTEKCLVLDVKTIYRGKTEKLPQTLMILQAGSVKISMFDSVIPEETPDGKYCVEFRLANRSLRRDKMLAEKIAGFRVFRPVIPEKVVPKEELPLSARITLLDFAKKTLAGEKFKISVSFRNTSSREGRFNVRVAVEKSGAGQPVKVFSRTLHAAENKTENMEFEYRIEPDLPDGEYSVKAEVSASGKQWAQVLLTSRRDVFRVIDTPPEIIFHAIPLSFDSENNTVYSVTAEDDREVKSVELSYILPKSDKYSSSQMQFSTGTKFSGTWACSLGRIKKSGKLMYYLTAADSKGQITKTEEFAVTILKK